MINLIVDIGNTQVKYALMDGQTLLVECRSQSFDIEQVVRIAQGRGVEWAVVSSTRGNSAEEVAHLETLGLRVLLFDSSTPVPIQSDYLTPHTLGRDRLAAAVGADTLYPQEAVLIVDFGTAITCDLVSGGVYRGGFISPGLRTRLRSLHHFTAKLPEVEPAQELKRLGLTTEECIAQGVEWGICYEIEGYIARFRAENEKLLIIFAGGDAKHFVKRIKNTIFAECDLVLVGLNRILEHYVQHKK